MRAELRAAEIGLGYAWSLGARKVILQLDSLATVNAILGPPTEDLRHSHTLLGIDGLRQRDWQVSVHHVFREANQVADLLAHLGHSKPLGTTFFTSCPSFIRFALFSDCIGTSFPRLIRSN
ncbi:Putative ribonuclease H protein At1g65750 [Linum perenne]